MGGSLLLEQAVSRPAESRLLAANTALRSGPGEGGEDWACFVHSAEHEGCAGPRGECLSHQPVIVNYILMYKFHNMHILKVKFYLALKVEGFFFSFIKISKSLVFGFECISRIPSLGVNEHPFRLCPAL